MKVFDRHRLKISLFLLFGLVGFLFVSSSGVKAKETASKEKAILGIIKKARFASEEAEKIKRTHFHNYIVDELPVNPNPAFCFVCHGNAPHANAKKTRSILNMHIVFLACETCHFRFNPKEKAKYGFRWFDGSEKIQGMERHYGTEYDTVSGRVLMEPGKTVAKITPFKMWEGKYYMVNLRMDAEEAQAYVNSKATGGFTPSQQAAFKTRLHTSISTKGRECSECHTADSVIPFRVLGFDAERIKDLAGLNIAGMVSKYQKFYIPDIFKQQQVFDSPLEEDLEDK